jgi:NADP-dependent aldehyde dehydrogenase
MIDQAVTNAEAAFEEYAALPPAEIGGLLEKIGDEIAALGDTLIECASAETALTPDRLAGERTRTVNQLRMFAEVVRHGAWKGVRIDRAIPDRRPARRPDLRRTLVPVGPAAVWAASNFPLAFSVAGGDTASALAAGCPVILKAHPGHPTTSHMVADAVQKAIRALALPDGIFTLVEGANPDVSLSLVRHPGIKAGAFTGSLRAGRALFDAAAQRPEPIPFFAEMGSVNPLFVLEGALRERGASIAAGLVQSVNLGIGQFCTNPGLTIGIASESFDRFVEQLYTGFRESQGGKMLTEAIAHSYCDTTAHLEALPGLRVTKGHGQPGPALFETNSATFLKQPELRHEVFGPSTILVRCESQEELEQVARALEGSLTATLHGTDDDFRANTSLRKILLRKAGRIIFNGFPTGVEVCPAMHHGGPYPATTDPRFTSVGSAAIARFARPVCFQDVPAEFLPAELKD